MEAPNDPKDLKKAVFPDVFTVDYVKVYKKKDQSSYRPDQRRAGSGII